MKDKIEEKWKNISPPFERYSLSNKGRLLNNETGCFLKVLKDRVYPYYALYNSEGSKKFSVHRLLAIHFIPNPLNKEQVNHKDGDKANFNLDNLEWATASENGKHRFQVLKHAPVLTSLGKFGKDAFRSIPVESISPDGEKAIFDSARDAADKLGISRTAVTRCARGETDKVKSGFSFKYLQKN